MISIRHHRDGLDMNGTRCFARLLCLVLCAVGASVMCFSPASAQNTGLLTSSYITPFPQTDRYQVRVIGDWLGSGLAAGLEEAFKQDGSLQVSDMSRSNYGLARGDQSDLFSEVDKMISGQSVNIVVIMLGANDRLSLRTATGRAQPGSDEWKDLYGKEAEKLIKKLKAANIAVYWVGLPIMSSPSLSETVAAMNDSVRQAAYLNGVKFIETWSGFTDQLGAYSAYGPDLTGQTKRLREGDGVGLTAVGNRKLANYVEIAIRRDLGQARAQRNIPLAGDEEEQARVVPGGNRNASARPTVGPDSKTVSASAPSSGRGDPQGTPALPAQSSVTAALPKQGPSAPAQVQAQAQAALPDASRRDQAAFAGSGIPQGEFILSDTANALTEIAVITPVSDFSIRELQRQTPIAERVYFRVLSKGEALPPKEGRADDFRWHGDQLSQTPSQ